MRQQGLDEIDVGIGQHCPVVVRDARLGNPPGFRASFGGADVAVAKGDDAGVRIGQVLDGVQVGNAARADNPHTDGVEPR